MAKVQHSKHILWGKWNRTNSGLTPKTITKTSDFLASFELYCEYESPQDLVKIHSIKIQ